MEVFFKILHFLCLLSVTICFHLTPSVHINTPIDFLLHNINPNNRFDQPNPHEQCFCLPINTNSQPVVNHLEPANDNVERVIVYLYKSDGLVKVYIPNKHKQELIPDLNFDDNEGDILKPVSSESIADLFDSSPIIVNSQQSITPITENTVIESEIIDAEPKPQRHMNNDNRQISEDTDFIFPIPSDDNSSPEYDRPFDEHNVSINIPNKSTSQAEGEDINNPGENKIENQDDADHLHEIPTIQPPNSLTGSQIEAVNIPHSAQLDKIPSMLPPKQSNIDIPDRYALNEIPNIDDSYQLHHIHSLLPAKPLSYIKSPLRQNPYAINSNNYLTFYDWFEDQLTRVVLYNLETPSKIIELRERIKKVLQNNGMHLGGKGIVTDSNGNLVRMSNIKLRPILIGDQVEFQNFGHRANLEESVVSYIQLIEIILATPPKLLGTLILGTVYLPRNVNGRQKFDLWQNDQYANIIRNGNPLVGCVTCKSNNPQNPYSYPYSFINGLQYPQITTAPYGVYGAYELPFRRNLSTEDQTRKAPSSNRPQHHQAIASRQPENEVSDDVSRNGLEGVFDGLLRTLGITPTLFANPTRRLLGGMVPYGPKPGPKPYPNDDLPGFRIIGGNAATSSGTPLVSKGRSGFVKPSFII